MIETLNEIWNWKLQVFPILLSVLLFEAPAIIRRLKRIYYVPIYFSVFPLRELNQDLSTYLVEDDEFAFGGDLTIEQAEKLRKKIIFISIISMFIGALLTPLLVGFSSAFYMNKQIFFQFITILIIYKIIFLSKSIYQFHYYAVATLRNRLFLGFIYFCYLGVVFEVLRQTYFWTLPYTQSGNWVALLSE